MRKKSPKRLALVALMVAGTLGALPVNASSRPASVKNGKIVFVHNGWVGGYPTGIHLNRYFDIFATDGSGEVEQLTQMKPVVEAALMPEVSPDGRWIAYTRFSVLDDYDSDLMLMRADGTDLRPLLEGSAYEAAPSWSPDGKKIVFELDAGLGILSLSDGKVTPLVLKGMEDGVVAWDPKWSPDGTRIAFEMGEAVYTVRPDGTGLRRVTHLPGVKAFDADWSPDGRWILFTRTRAAEPGVAGLPADHLASDIWIVRADGTGERNLTDTGGSLYEEGPTWSPDGKKIAFVRGTGQKGAWDIWVMTREGKEQKRLYGVELQHVENNRIYWLDWAPQPR